MSTTSQSFEVYSTAERNWPSPRNCSKRAETTLRGSRRSWGSTLPPSIAGANPAKSKGVTDCFRVYVRQEWKDHIPLTGKDTSREPFCEFLDDCPVRVVRVGSEHFSIRHAGRVRFALAPIHHCLVAGLLGWWQTWVLVVSAVFTQTVRRIAVQRHDPVIGVFNLRLNVVMAFDLDCYFRGIFSRNFRVAFSGDVLEL
jgi:hypothetical protein